MSGKRTPGNMRCITIDNTPPTDFHQFMLGAVTPRPIAWVSTVDEKGIRNLAPFSYFNAVSSIPPVLMISISRKADGSKKDTLVNIETTGELVVNMVPHNRIWQMALSSVQIPADADEFRLAGLQALDSTRVKPPRVTESPVHFECRVRDIIHLGTGPGESSLILADVLCLHIDEAVIDPKNRIDPLKLDLVGRLGRSNYCRMQKDTIEPVHLPQTEIPIGFDALPEAIRNSNILSANDLAMLASATEYPDPEAIEVLQEQLFKDGPRFDTDEIHQLIRQALKMSDLEYALALTFTVS